MPRDHENEKMDEIEYERYWSYMMSIKRAFESNRKLMYWINEGCPKALESSPEPVRNVIDYAKSIYTAIAGLEDPAKKANHEKAGLGISFITFFMKEVEKLDDVMRQDGYDHLTNSPLFQSNRDYQIAFALRNMSPVLDKIPEHIEAIRKYRDIEIERKQIILDVDKLNSGYRKLVNMSDDIFMKNILSHAKTPEQYEDYSKQLHEDLRDAEAAVKREAASRERKMAENSGKENKYEAQKKLIENLNTECTEIDKQLREIQNQKEALKSEILDLRIEYDEKIRDSAELRESYGKKAEAYQKQVSDSVAKEAAFKYASAEYQKKYDENIANIQKAANTELIPGYTLEQYIADEFAYEDTFSQIKNRGTDKNYLTEQKTGLEQEAEALKTSKAAIKELSKKSHAGTVNSFFMVLQQVYPNMKHEGESPQDYFNRLSPNGVKAEFQTILTAMKQVGCNEPKNLKDLLDKFPAAEQNIEEKINAKNTEIKKNGKENENLDIELAEIDRRITKFRELRQKKPELEASYQKLRAGYEESVKNAKVFQSQVNECATGLTQNEYERKKAQEAVTYNTNIALNYDREKLEAEFNQKLGSKDIRMNELMEKECRLKDKREENRKTFKDLHESQLKLITDLTNIKARGLDYEYFDACVRRTQLDARVHILDSFENDLRYQMYTQNSLVEHTRNCKRLLDSPEYSKENLVISNSKLSDRAYMMLKEMNSIIRTDRMIADPRNVNGLGIGCKGNSTEYTNMNNSLSALVDATEARYDGNSEQRIYNALETLKNSAQAYLDAKHAETRIYRSHMRKHRIRYAKELVAMCEGEMMRRAHGVSGSQLDTIVKETNEYSKLKPVTSVAQAAYDLRNHIQVLNMEKLPANEKLIKDIEDINEQAVMKAKVENPAEIAIQ